MNTKKNIDHRVWTLKYRTHENIMFFSNQVSYHLGYPKHTWSPIKFPSSVAIKALFFQPEIFYEKYFAEKWNV